jgi:hypothetical protein
MGFDPEGVGKETTPELNREACTSDDVAEAARRASIPFAHLALAIPGPEAEEQS